MDFCSRCDPFYYLSNNDSDDDSETTEYVVMGKSESKPLVATYQVKLESMDNAYVPTLSKDNYQQWKGKMKHNIMYVDISNLVCNGYTEFLPSDKEVQKNSKDLSNIFYSIILLQRKCGISYKKYMNNSQRKIS